MGYECEQAMPVNPLIFREKLEATRVSRFLVIRGRCSHFGSFRDGMGAKWAQALGRKPDPLPRSVAVHRPR